MKRTVIGGVLVFNGTLISVAILIVAALYVPEMTTWRGSKLWFAIFGTNDMGNQAVQSLFLGLPFLVGVLLFVLGLIVLAVEYFRKD